ncbi:conserved hypothetical protein [Cupriavidus taiwanensis LMG 19424]|uniref:Uncharacterized protein n=1 Tax=Cupriavidus taiwanensis (strain DSM 17343 / BCRC 17206 / CCUG 44338 / CIP 107171 / LMG 19424 / R1) TaxID=977880 RepID=B3R3M4_CUPTR|nr:conserved hypothetical protein [Cupriavidus taiwanensis LMG 19424]
MNSPRRVPAPHPLRTERLTKSQYLREARNACLSLSVPPGIIGPYKARSLNWNANTYYYVFGQELAGPPRLIEVFRVNGNGELYPVPAFQYPEPFKELFPTDYAILYSDDPWDGAFPPAKRSEVFEGD